MPQVINSNTARLKGKPKESKTPEGATAPITPQSQVQVIQGNVPLLTVQLLDMILKELRSLNSKFDHIGLAEKKNG